jgi:hypothetical protein
MLCRLPRPMAGLQWRVATGLSAGERIQASVCGYFIKPRAKEPALDGLKVVEASPGTQIRLLYEVLRFVDGAEHAVTVHVEFAAEWFREPSKLLLPFRAFRLMCRSICHRKSPLGSVMKCLSRSRNPVAIPSLLQVPAGTGTSHR